MKAKRLLPALALAFFGFTAEGLAARQSEPATVAPEIASRLAAGEDRVLVLVGFREQASEPGATEVTTSGTSMTRPRVRVERLLAEISPLDFTPTRTFATAPLASGWLTARGLAALKARADVASISIDGTVRPAGQIGAAQIGADRLNLIGVTGRGRSVAIVDTGLDISHPDMGGRMGPNSKILAGWNFADGNDDLSDCLGHGTEVAGVAAGPQGIAPEADIVVLKVFGQRDGCRGAAFSDVLAAIDWVVDRRETLRVEAINLSLSDESAHPGFCDAENRAAAQVFDTARAAGIAVVAAAGNSALKDGLAWPGCFSGVAAVGMVYSTASGPISWGGMAVCRDATTAADMVPCASNSGSGLAVLAPGVGWVTSLPGGESTSTFSGTSAAAPAATGALLLARQARVLSDPLLALDLLRTTGVPVRDSGNGRTAPRIDLVSALDATTPISGPCNSEVLPDGKTAGMTCEAYVSSLVGTAASVSVSLSIDHPDPTQLVVTLTSPDGTSVLLMNRSGTAGHAVREVFGKTAQPIEPLSAFVGRAVSGVWRLKVLDTVPGGAGRLVSWSLAIEPQAVPFGPLSSPATAFVPSAAHMPGKFGSFFTTDLRVFNSDPNAAARVALKFTPNGGDPAKSRTTAVTIPPLGTRVLDDVLGNVFRTTDYGPLAITAPPSVVIGSRTRSTSVRGGAYGLYVPAVSPSSAIGLGDRPVYLVAPIRSDGFRLNVGLSEVSGAAARVEITVKDRLGAVKGSFTTPVTPLALTQLNDAYQSMGIATDESDRFEVRVVGGTGRVVAWGTAVDNKTNDAIFVLGATPGPDVLVPATSRAVGQHGAVYRTDLKLTNPGPAPIRVRVTYFPTTGPAFSRIIVPLQANETRLLADALYQLYSPHDNVSGALRITTLDGPFVSSSRTYTADDSGGSYGMAIDHATSTFEATPGRRIALTFLSGTADTRTNVGFLETSGKTTRARLSFYTPDGSRFFVKDLTFEAQTAIQWNDVFATLGLTPRAEASAILEVLDGGAVEAHVIQINNSTNDASFVPGSLLP